MKKGIKAIVMLIVLSVMMMGCFGTTGTNAVNGTEKAVSTGKKAFSSNYTTIYFRGTPNNWGTTAMTLTANNVWSIQATFGSTSTERFKFDATTNWATNWGDSNGDKIADANGSDIGVTAGKTYDITFNDSTKAYTVTEVSSKKTVRFYASIDGIGFDYGIAGVQIKVYKTSDLNTVVTTATFTSISQGNCVDVPNFDAGVQYKAVVSQEADLTYTGSTQRKVVTGEATFTTTTAAIQPSVNLALVSSVAKRTIRFYAFTDGLPFNYGMAGVPIKFYKTSNLNTVVTTANYTSSSEGNSVDVANLEVGESYKAVVKSDATLSMPWGGSEFKYVTGEATFVVTSAQYNPSVNITITSEVAKRNVWLNASLDGMGASYSIGGVKVKLYKMPAHTLVTTQAINSSMYYSDTHFTKLEANTTYQAEADEIVTIINGNYRARVTGTAVFTTNELNVEQPSAGINLISSIPNDKTVYIYPQVTAVNFTGTPGMNSMARTLTVELYKGTTLVKTTTIDGTSPVSANFYNLERGATYTVKLPAQIKNETNPAYLISGDVKYTGTDITFTAPTDETQLASMEMAISAQLMTKPSAKIGTSIVNGYVYDTMRNPSILTGMTMNLKKKNTTTVIATATVTYDAGITNAPRYGLFSNLDAGSYTVTLNGASGSYTYAGTLDFDVTSTDVVYTMDVNYTVNFAKTYPTMYFRGTPNNWGATAMTLVADYTWKVTVTTGTTATERFKVDAYANWASTNWGDNNGDLVGEQGGGDIPLLANSTYDITFDDSTKKFTVTKK